MPTAIILKRYSTIAKRSNFENIYLYRRIYVQQARSHLLTCVPLICQPVQLTKGGIKDVAFLPHDDEDFYAIVHGILKQPTYSALPPRERVRRINVRCDAVSTHKASQNDVAAVRPKGIR
jgi:hypothetical protein